MKTAAPARLVAAILALLMSVNAALAMDLAVREMQRRLFILGYEVGLPDGAAGPKTRAALARFIADNPALQGQPQPAIDEALEKAVAESRDKIARNNEGVGFLVNPHITLDFVVAMPAHERLLTGSCKNIGQIDLASNSTITIQTANCSHLVGYSQRHDAIVAGYSDALVLGGAGRIGMPTLDVISYPGGRKAGLTKGAVGDGGSTALVPASDKSIMLLDLQAPYRARVLGQHRFGLDRVVGAEAAPVFAVASSEYVGNKKRRETILLDADAADVLLRSDLEFLALSDDGRYAALFSESDGEIVIRDLVGGGIAAKRDAGDLSTSRFTPYAGNDNSVRFTGDGELSYAVVLPYAETPQYRVAKWNWRTGETSAIPLPALDTGGYVHILPALGRVLAMAGGALASFDLSTGREIVRARSRPYVQPVASTLRTDLDELLMIGDGEDPTVYVVDLQTGALKGTHVLPFEGPADEKWTGKIEAAASDGVHLVTMDSRGRLSVYDAAMKPVARNPASVTSDYMMGGALAVSRRGDLLARTYNVKDRLSVDIFSLPSLAPVRSVRFNDTRSPEAIAFVDDDRRILVDGYTMRVFDVATGKVHLSREFKAFIDAKTFFKGWVGYIAPSRDGSEFVVGSPSFGPDAVLHYSSGRITRQHGREKPGQGNTMGGSNFGVMLDDGRLVVEHASNRMQLRTGRFETSTYETGHGTLDGGVLSLHALPGNRFVVVDKGGQIDFFDPNPDAGGDVPFGPYVRMNVLADGNWLTRTAHGFFAGTEAAARMLNIRLGEKRLVPVDSLFDTLYRADLVAEAMAGDPDGKVAQAARETNLEQLLSSGSPPEIVVLAPQAELSTAEGAVVSRIRLENRGGGIGRVEWRVNGTTRAVRERGGDDPETLTLEEELLLDAAENTIEIIAYNAANKVASRPVAARVTWTGFLDNQTPRLHVLSVGVNDYFDSRLRLNHARQDAEAIAAALATGTGSVFESVSVRALVDAEVTRAGLQAAFAELSRSIRSFDVFVLFVAGHGVTQDGRYYYIPQDFRYTSAEAITEHGIRQEDWQSWLSGLPAGKSLLLFDTCESGTLTGDITVRSGLDRLSAVDRLTRATGRSVLSAATDTGPALEGYKGHGVFAYTLLEAMGAADGNGNGLLEITELAGHVDARVPEISMANFGFRQIPQMRIVGENFSIARVSADLVPQGDDARIARQPTHVLIAPASLLAGGDAAAEVLSTLPVGQLLTVVSTEGGFAQVARDGAVLGFVAADAMAQILR